MLFQDSVRRELARSFGATTIVLITVVMTMTLIRTVGAATRGTFNPSDVLLVMGYTVLAYMPTILTMGLFIAIIGSFSRMYRESEMVIWFSSGVGLATLVRPALRFAWPVLIVIAVFALAVLPWCNASIEQLKDRYERRGDLERVQPGHFQESADGKRVYFVDKDGLGRASGASVFVATHEHGTESVTSASGGRVEGTGDEQRLVLSNGQQLRTRDDDSAFSLSEFRQFRTRIDPGALRNPDDVSANTLDTLTLLASTTPDHLGELSWRIGLILASFNLILIGVPVSAVNPRMGRSGNLLFALFTYIVYYNLINLGQNWIATGSVRLVPFVGTLHGGTLLLTLAWLALRHNNWRWRRALRLADKGSA